MAALAQSILKLPIVARQRRVADVGTPQVALEFGDQFERAFCLVEGRARGKEVARIGEAIAADRQSKFSKTHQYKAI